MNEKLNTITVVKTIILIPLFFSFLGICCVVIVFCTIIPYGSFIATKVYELFGYVGLKVVGIKINMTGEEYIDVNQSYVVVSNHPSTLDIFTHIHTFPISVRFLTKSELYKIPIFGSTLKALGLPRVDRNNAGKKEINRSVEEVVGKKNSIMVFAEGTRSNSDNSILPFKKGAAWLAINYNLPVLPVATTNGAKLMPRGKIWLRRGEIDIHIFKPIETSKMTMDNVQELTRELENLIRSRIQ
tara:strand:+ start:68 stop:793 length:726 start_codon:yes stop_codon:yes gene_type:complete